MMQPGDLGVASGTAWDDRLIAFGQRLHGAGPLAKWDHAFIIVSQLGDTIEAQGQGVVRMRVTDHPIRLIIPAPSSVDRAKVVAFAVSKLGQPYDYFNDVLLGLDCLVRKWDLHRHTDSWICSELAAAAWIAGGWISPLPPSATYPYDIASHTTQGVS